MIARSHAAVASMLLVTGLALVAHGGYELHRRNSEEAARDHVYALLLDALAADRMAEVLTLTGDFVAKAPIADPRLPQIREFALEARAREAVRLTREGDPRGAERVLSQLDQLVPPRGQSSRPPTASPEPVATGHDASGR
jgi:hypothetical protein